MGPNRRRWSSFPGAPGGGASGASGTTTSAPGGSNAAPRSLPFRAHARKAVRLQSVFTHVQAGWQQTATIENIGLGGARVVLDNPLATGDPVSLSFTAPTLWDPLVLRARVAWVGAAAGPGPRAAGIAFEHKSTDAVFALYELIVTMGYE
ncbi:MAG TPA: PilZ domain-containing protein [Polyangiaceae bacterium]|jgi:hypothetical protein|nr:PilZ domain-containing protein [Polyangiaceae bacterium]